MVASCLLILMKDESLRNQMSCLGLNVVIHHSIVIHILTIFMMYFLLNGFFFFSCLSIGCFVLLIYVFTSFL